MYMYGILGALGVNSLPVGGTRIVGGVEGTRVVGGVEGTRDVGGSTGVDVASGVLPL